MGRECQHFGACWLQNNASLGYAERELWEYLSEVPNLFGELSTESPIPSKTCAKLVFYGIPSNF